MALALAIAKEINCSFLGFFGLFKGFDEKFGENSPSNTGIANDV
jgi:hypothetical protein